MAQALFEDTEKAKRWLTKPKVSLSGNSPMRCFPLRWAHVGSRRCWCA
ncbi:MULTISPECIES: MbcA/ParS/Xre antitoxin family protein [Pseudomonas]|nr:MULTISPECIES: MbcA/ParS/Xre antitoxin family protein [Pseudomonadaceae]WRU66448.1 MbcA/ParS/Xre antitoxin family protein [Pseudomonas veronii]